MVGKLKIINIIGITEIIEKKSKKKNNIIKTKSNCSIYKGVVGVCVCNRVKLLLKLILL